MSREKPPKKLEFATITPSAWQLQRSAGGATTNTGHDVDLFDNDPSLISGIQASGKRVICHFSTGSQEDFWDEAGRFQESDLGNPLGDFPDERWADVRSSNVRSVMAERLTMAASKDCDGGRT